MRVGYSGGTTPGPTYHGLGDHSESVQIGYDPAKITYERLLAEFWDAHDPTEAPWSRQYRSAIFVHDAEQRRAAERSMAIEAKKLGQPIETAIEDFGTFTAAEDYHQKYELRHVGPVWAELVAAYPRMEDLVRSTAAARMNAWVAGYGTEADLRVDELGLSERAKKVLLSSRSR